MGARKNDLVRVPFGDLSRDRDEQARGHEEIKQHQEADHREPLNEAAFAFAQVATEQPRNDELGVVGKAPRATAEAEAIRVPSSGRPFMPGAATSRLSEGSGAAAVGKPRASEK